MVIRFFKSINQYGAAKKIVAISAISFFSAGAMAADLYVSPQGSDTNPGTSTAPLRTIQKASDVAVAGTTVHVAPGSYTETIKSMKSGTSSARIRFVSDTKWGAILKPAAGAYTMWSVTGGYTDIDGFQIDGSGSTSVRIGISLTGGNSSVKNSWVHHLAENSGCDNMGGAGLLANQARGSSYTNYDFLNNKVHNVGGGCGWIQGIYHQSTGNIKNNLIYACSQAVDMGHDAHNINVTNNTFFGNSGYGIYFGGCKEAYNNGCPTSGIKIYNNIIYDNGGGVQGPIATEDVGNEVKNNLVYGNRINFDLANPSTNSRTGEVNAEPQFVSYVRAGGGNYHLKSTSPAIDRGLASVAPALDLDGVARQGAAPEIGAYEYAVAPSPSPSPSPAPAPAPAPAPTAAPVLSLSTSSLAFGNQLVGSTSAVKVVTATNTGTAPLIFSSNFTMTGDFTFGGTGTCVGGVSYAPGASCTVSAVFKPTASGTRQGVLSIISNASTTARAVALSGTGTVPTVDIKAPVTSITSPSNGSYIPVRTTITIRAQATDNVAVKSVDFYVNNSLKCTATVAPYSCTWTVPWGRGTSYILQTRARDAAGNVGISSQVKIISK